VYTPVGKGRGRGGRLAPAMFPIFMLRFDNPATVGGPTAKRFRSRTNVGRSSVVGDNCGGDFGAIPAYVGRMLSSNPLWDASVLTAAKRKSRLEDP
jgi:hypothetical protein